MDSAMRPRRRHIVRCGVSIIVKILRRVSMSCKQKHYLSTIKPARVYLFSSFSIKRMRSRRVRNGYEMAAKRLRIPPTTLKDM
jgi:hypothetical protein